MASLTSTAGRLCSTSCTSAFPALVNADFAVQRLTLACLNAASILTFPCHVYGSQRSLSNQKLNENVSLGTG